MVMYFDYAATSPCEYWPDYTDFFNPNAMYAWESAQHLQDLREQVKQELNVNSGKVIFCASASQAIAVLGNYLYYNCEPYEHVSVYDNSVPFKGIAYAHQYVNQLNGCVFNIEKIAKQKKKEEGYKFFFSDFTAAIGKVELPEYLDTFCDAVWFSAHKFYGPVGIGCLWISDEVFEFLALKDNPVDEYGLYYGTPNLPGIEAMVDALHDRNDTRRIKSTEKLGKKLNNVLVSHGAKATFMFDNLDRELKLSYINSINLIHFDGIDNNESLCRWLVGKNCCVGLPHSACEADSDYRVYKALGLDMNEVQHCLRLSYGISNCVEEIEKFINLINEYKARYC